MIQEHDSEWMDYPVEVFDPEEGVTDYKNTIYRLAIDWDEKRTLVDLLAIFLKNPAAVDAPAIVIGTFGESDTDPSALVEALVAARDRLPNLKGIFVGDIVGEENEISWIQQADLSSLFLAFPRLEHFRCRGGNGLVLGRIDHANLRSLTVEAGGLPRTVVRDILASSLPALEHLEIWSGTDSYGWDGSLQDFQPLFERQLFPSLKYLGLRNSEIADEIAAAWAGSRTFPGLSTLDLSLGTLSDEGAAHLLTSPNSRTLQKLDLHHHFLSEGMMVRLQQTFPFVNVDDVQVPDEWDGRERRFVAVSEQPLRSAGTEPSLVVLGNPENRRVRQFVEAARPQWRCIREVSWLDFLSDPGALGELEGNVLRIESSGENFAVERKLLLRGHSHAIKEGGSEVLSPEELQGLAFERGRILPLRQWYLGWKDALEALERLIRDARSCRVMNAPEEISRLFDKEECHRMLAARGLKTPALVSRPASFDQLIEDMQAAQARRIFLKPCHSSSASGIVALESGPRGLQAFTTIERHAGALYNSLRIHRHTGRNEIRAIVDAICRHRCLAERWLPKAGFQGARLDLRILVVAGRAAHAVLRQSKGPMTNLHLGNRRGDLAAFRQHLGEPAWQKASEQCEAAAAAFPRALYAGVDLLISPSLKKFAVAEVNAFGDLLPGLKYEGLGTYELELQRLKEKAPTGGDAPSPSKE